MRPEAIGQIGRKFLAASSDLTGYTSMYTCLDSIVTTDAACHLLRAPRRSPVAAQERYLGEVMYCTCGSHKLQLPQNSRRVWLTQNPFNSAHLLSSGPLHPRTTTCLVVQLIATVSFRLPRMSTIYWSMPSAVRTCVASSFRSPVIFRIEVMCLEPPAFTPS